MRDIKFRAWDKRENRERFLPKEFMEQLYLRQDGKIIWWAAANGFTDVSDIFEINLFTGLKDKNGVEIYEGDIIQDEDSISIIDMSNPYWCGNLLTNISQCEVIGNIYESKDLLQ